VTTFEKSTAPREAGAWISLTESGIDVLSNFIDLDDIHNITARPGATDLYKHIHWKTGEVISNQETFTSRKDIRGRVSKTHRWALLELLLRNIPKGSIQYGRIIQGVEFDNAKNTVFLKYKDVSRVGNNNEVKEETRTEEFDLIVAADGIYSKIRTQIYPDLVLASRGAISYRNIFPEGLISHIDGAKPTDGSFAYRKDDEVFFFGSVGLGQYGLVIGLKESQDVVDKVKWDKTVDENHLQKIRDHFIDWPPVVKEILKVVPYLNAFPLESAPWLEHLSYQDRIAFVGDAAHPTSGAFGAGSAFGFGDVWALYRSLKETGTNNWKRRRAELNDSSFSENNQTADTYNLKSALFLFDETRRYYLKDVYEQIGRDRLSADYVQDAKDEDEKIERYVKVADDANWISEHNVEIEFQRVRSKHVHLFYE
jgi:salicylate hydroxylase